MPDRDVDVDVDIAGRTERAGRLWLHRRNGTESATFQYEADYLTRDVAYELDPGLPLVAYAQQTPVGRALFGAFSDCAPDGWGRRLILRADESRARAGGGARRSFGEADYLLGVRDDLRQGALRLRDRATGHVLADEDEGVPHLVDLPRLLSAAERLEDDTEDAADLRALLRGGSSLGGARPKAHVRIEGGALAIAKFPSPANDAWDVIRWEAVALRLAAAAGVTTPPSRLEVIDGRPVLVVERFDRTGTGRIGYVSAMTMLEATDGDQAGYADIAEVIEDRSPQTTLDLRELWRRMAFTVLIHNTDDHLRNHGFLRTSSAGWSLSPVFDINPDPDPGPAFLRTALDQGRFEAAVPVLMEVAALFRLDAAAATAVLAEVSSAVSTWRTVAAACGLPRAAIERMAPAFEHRESEAAQALRP